MSASGQLCFSRDESIARWREHSISLERNKRFTQTPRVLFSLGLSAVEWSVFMYYYSLAPGDHPGEEHVAARLCIGRKTLRQTLFRLQGRGMIFFDGLRRNRHRLVNISHPFYWSGLSIAGPGAGTADPGSYEPLLHLSLHDRKNEARDYFKGPGQHIALPYLLFQLSISPIAKILYGLICHLGIYDHPTTEELAAVVGCSPDTAARNLSFLVDAGMLDFTVREPDSFGSRIRYYYHTCDVGRWKFKKAQVWYPDSRPAPTRDTVSAQRLYNPRDDHEDYRFSDRPALPLISTQLGWNEPWQPASQLGQIATQLGQSAHQLGQVSSQLCDGPHQKQVQKRLCGESAETKENKNKEENHKQEISKRGVLAGSSVFDIDSLSKRWNPEKRSFSPRIINIAKAAAIAWESRGLRFDPTLWTGFVENIALERGEEGACEFAEFVIVASNERGRKLPYDPLVMRQLKKDFLKQVVMEPDPRGTEELVNTRETRAVIQANAGPGTAKPETASIRRTQLESEAPSPEKRNPIGSLPENDAKQRLLINHVWRRLRKTQKADLQRLWGREPGQTLSRFANASPENLQIVLDGSVELRAVNILRPEEVPPLPWERING